MVTFGQKDTYRRSYGVYVQAFLTYCTNCTGWRPAGTAKSCQSFPESAPQPEAAFLHAMDCTDMIIGSVIDGRHRIGDYYTRDRSTPRHDSYYGGQSDLVGALGWTEDGVTKIMFQRAVSGTGQSDWDFRGDLHFIYAHGQEEGGNEFYVQKELKYHGSFREAKTITGM